VAGQTIRLVGQTQRDFARQMIHAAPQGAVVNIRAATRSTDQNSKMWAMLSDVSRSKPNDRMHTPDIWKAIFMNALGHQVQFVPGLEGEPFPIGFRSSKMNKEQMADLITYIQWYGDTNSVAWTEPQEIDE
jgi:hypothetical protein